MSEGSVGIDAATRVPLGDELPDGEDAAHQRDALLHAEQSQAPAPVRRGSLLRRGRIPMPLSSIVRSTRSVPLPEHDAHPGGSGVLADVGQGLLGHPVEHEFNFRPRAGCGTRRGRGRRRCRWCRRSAGPGPRAPPGGQDHRAPEGGVPGRGAGRFRSPRTVSDSSCSCRDPDFRDAARI